METQKIVGFKRKSPLPWGFTLNSRILWVLWFKSRTFFKFLGNNLINDTLTIPAVGKTLTFKKPTLLQDEKKKTAKATTKSMSQEVNSTTNPTTFSRFLFHHNLTFSPPPSLPNVADLGQANGTPSWSSSRALRKEAPLPEIQRHFRWKMMM